MYYTLKAEMTLSDLRETALALANLRTKVNKSMIYEEVTYQDSYDIWYIEIAYKCFFRVYDDDDPATYHDDQMDPDKPFTYRIHSFNIAI